MQTPSSLFINGRWLQGQGQRLTSCNPASGQQLWAGHCASSSQVEMAVDAARNASSHWREMTVAQRQHYILRFTQHLNEYSELLADTIGQETGKPLWESRTEISAMLGKTDISIRAYAERCPTRREYDQQGEQVLRHKPQGVVAIFGPYNFPMHLPNGHIIPALLAGNTVIFKPSELTPRCAELMTHLWQKAELPDGVLNLLQGDSETGKALASASDINGLFFTGSATTGQLLHHQFAGHPEKILALEMGGNNPLLITPMSNMKAVLHDTIVSAFSSAGQRCTCARRLLVPASSWGDRYLKELLQACQKIRIDRYNAKPQPFMGTLINNVAAEAILAAQQQLHQQGAELLLEAQPLHNIDAMLSPALIDTTSIPDMADEEYFGPLLQVIRYRDFDSAIEIANHTAYGLAAGLYSDDADQYAHFQRHIRAGIINWNRPLTGASSQLPFGGCGISGNHRPSAYYAADYCAYAVASLESNQPRLPTTLSPGLAL
ncbi:succinylglutamate-semialdehyde dehydrogenase [Amphritea sp. 1_MG-2023]|uniref:succinylglutamate-semialdehyde dehydrogenase n=1 Tax=Amphritea sp. 1_MG-2023 TaxID=3062670 RepID=UPI0026E2DEB5|nr:succinylglutamate-semialdehyde dehydrogenase [Amphritea sp. 1_MG-2023]MDO6564808.1 succinylglutamate-semialdehyde dehydrogenase [Amphritea sp. 1_MG-2023]